MNTVELSPMQIRQIQAHLKAVQDILATKPRSEAAETPVNLFLAAHICPAPGVRTALRDIHAAHVAWCKERGYEPLHVRALGKHLQGPRVHSNSVAYIIGLRLI